MARRSCGFMAGGLPVKGPAHPPFCDASSLKLPCGDGYRNAAGGAAETCEERAPWGDVDGYAVEERDCKAGQWRDPGAGEHDPDQIQRVGGGEDYGLGLVGGSTRGSQRFDRLGQGKLLAGESAYEPPTPNRPLRFPSPILLEQGAPRWCAPLAGDEIAADHAVTPQQLTGE